MSSENLPEEEPEVDRPWFQSDENIKEDFDRDPPDINWLDLLTPRLCLYAESAYATCSYGHTFVPDMKTLASVGLRDTYLTDIRFRCPEPQCKSLGLTLRVGAHPPPSPQ
jgi:hypothetical protein